MIYSFKDLSVVRINFPGALTMPHRRWGLPPGRPPFSDDILKISLYHEKGRAKAGHKGFICLGPLALGGPEAPGASPPPEG